MKAENINIKEYFKNNKNIPMFQRDYVWENKKLDEIYEELFTSYEDDEDLFLGSVYLDKNDVVDGQQRTTFLYILLNELFISFFRREKIINEKIKLSLPKEKEKYENIKKYILKTYNNLDLKKENKKLEVYKSFPKNQNDFDFFDLRRKLCLHAKILRKKNQIQEKNNPLVNLDFLYHILKRVTLTANYIQEKDNINDVFSSINSKAANLDIWDLLKNDLHKIDKKYNYLHFEDLRKYIKNDKKNLDESNLLDKALINYALSTLIIDHFKEIPSKKDIYKKSKLILDKQNVNYISSLENIFKNMINLISSEPNGENIELLWLYKLIEKINLRQIKTIFWWSYSKGHHKNKKYKNNFFVFYKKLIIYFLIYVNINDKRANKFESLFKQKENYFFDNLEKYKYNFNEIIKNDEILKTVKSTSIKKIIDVNSDEYFKFSRNDSYLYIGYFLSTNDIELKICFYNKCFNKTATIEHVLDKNKKVEEVHLIGNKIIIDKKKNQNFPKEYEEKVDHYFEGPNKIVIFDPDKKSFDYQLLSTFIKSEDNFNKNWHIDEIKEKTKFLIELIFNKMSKEI